MKRLYLLTSAGAPWPHAQPIFQTSMRVCYHNIYISDIITKNT